MTGGGFFPGAPVDDYDLDENGTHSHAVQWLGTPGVKGPRWARMPLLTIGMLGIQCVWSIEMGYASPYLLELGLSKSFMSLVFMAGPLSGLVVQPLIGVFADRSKHRLGRRRPFMIAGCAICAFAMMLLGWAREVSHLVGGGNGLAIAFAVFAIYLVDFSINAVMSADRALVVDTLPPSQQEEGSAWAGRMFGFGSVAGFFVGNLDLPPVLPFLGKTQLQILSFVTSAILLIAHAFTSWATTERVLLRDDRPQSKGGLWSNLKEIWDNIFTLPPGIRTVCYIQFFAFLGWFPVLFFTSIWVSELYKTSHPELDPNDPVVAADAVRAGARSLFFQALVTITSGVALPFLVCESGVQPESNQYKSLAEGEPPRSALWKRAQAQLASGSAFQKAIEWAKGVIDGSKNSGLGLPIKGVTTVNLWWISQYVFAVAMLCTWFTSSVTGAHVIIGITGFSWALCQWAPYCLLGELILIEGSIDRSSGVPLVRQTRPSIDSDLDDGHPISAPAPHPAVSSLVHPSRPLSRHSRNTSRSSTDGDSFTLKPKLVLQTATPEPSPLVAQAERMTDENEVSLVLHHAEPDFDDDYGRPQSPFRPVSPRSTTLSPAVGASASGETADKAGVILGIHNVFIVLPQFVVTVLAAIIFYLMEPGKTLPETHPAIIPVVGNASIAAHAVARTAKLMVRGEIADAKSPDAVGLIFRIGAVSAAIGGFVTMRLASAWRRGEGI